MDGALTFTVCVDSSQIEREKTQGFSCRRSDHWATAPHSWNNSKVKANDRVYLWIKATKTSSFNSHGYKPHLLLIIQASIWNSDGSYEADVGTILGKPPGTRSQKSVSDRRKLRRATHKILHLNTSMAFSLYTNLYVVRPITNWMKNSFTYGSESNSTRNAKIYSSFIHSLIWPDWAYVFIAVHSSCCFLCVCALLLFTSKIKSYYYWHI